MEKYARILIILFFLSMANLGLSAYLILKISKLPEPKPTPTTVSVKASPTPSSKPAIIDNSDIKSDLTTIKAEIRALRESLDITGILKPTEAP